MTKVKSSISILSLIIIGLLTQNNFAQNISNFEYINPKPNSKYVSVETEILIRQGSPISPASINDNLVQAEGTKSGAHSGMLTLSDDSKTIIFTPAKSFQADEDVSVILKSGLISENGIPIGNLKFQFHTCKSKSKHKYITTENQTSSFPIYQNINSSDVPDTSLPVFVPKIIVNTYNNPSPGYIFLCASPYILIIDNEGTPIFFRHLKGTVHDFKLQPSGELTYFSYPAKCFGMDSSYNVTRNFVTSDGFIPDLHELLVLPDKSYYIIGKRTVNMDLSKIVSGGDTNAAVVDNDIQKHDASGNLVFEWDGLEHYKITDVDSNLDLTQHTIDFTHCNAITIDTDGNPILSTRNFDEITKIDYNTGKIIWRWGGENNQFTFINDNLGFSRQHFIRRFSNGNFGLFDNGIYHKTQISSGCEYKLDEVNKTATLLRRVYDGKTFTPGEGSYQELPNGNRLLAWGRSWQPFLTEVTPNDSVALRMSYPSYVNTYRALRFIWKTNRFTTNVDSLNFENVSVGNYLVKNITVYNPKDSDLVINGFYCKNSSFTTSLSLPVTIHPKDSINIPVKFKPQTKGSVKAAFNIRSFSMYNNFKQLIARQVILKGNTNILSSISNSEKAPIKFELFQNYPNPFNPSTTIKYSIPKESFVSLKIYDVLGNEVKNLVHEEKQPGEYMINFNGSNLSSGFYFYKLAAGNYIVTKKMILLK